MIVTSSFSVPQELLGATCATPPHLEGAPLLQIPLQSLNCDGNVNKYDNDVLQQLEALSKQRNLSYVKDFSDLVWIFDYCKNISFAHDNLSLSHRLC